MSYQLRFDSLFQKQVKNLPGDIRGVARKLIRELANQPRPRQAKELDDHPGYYRLRLPRDHRLVWNVLDSQQLVDLLYIGPKSDDLYNRLGLGRVLSGN